jgi:hypothetical protein
MGEEERLERGSTLFDDLLEFFSRRKSKRKQEKNRHRVQPEVQGL